MVLWYKNKYSGLLLAMFYDKIHTPPPGKALHSVSVSDGGEEPRGGGGGETSPYTFAEGFPPSVTDSSVMSGDQDIR